MNAIFAIRSISISTILLVLSILLIARPAEAQRLRENLEVRRLDNGMTFLFYPRQNAPVFSVVAAYNVGSVNEVDGYTGMAHLLEHMAFKGTPHIGTKNWKEEREIIRKVHSLGETIAEERLKPNPDTARIQDLEQELAEWQKEQRQYIVKDEFDAILSSHGGTGLNASTSRDFTMYYINLPSNKLELWALLESQRMRNPVWREFFSERDVVMEERRLRYENRAEGKLWETINNIAFIAHPYRNPTIGWMSDLQILTPSKGWEFFNTHYTPQNATVAIVGDIDPDEAMPVIEKYFGDWTSSAVPTQPTLKEPPQEGERRAKVHFNAQPQVVAAYHKPNWDSRSDVVMDVIVAILTDGRTSRLYDRMVKKDQIAVSIGAFGGPGDKFPNLAMFWGVPRSPHTTAEIEETLYEELERLKKEPVSDRELQKVKNRLDGQFIRDLQSNSGLARQLAYYASLTGDPYFIDKRIEEMKSVSKEEIQKVASEIFVESNRTVVELVTENAE